MSSRILDSSTRSNPLHRRLRRLSAGERRDEALAFIDLFHRENRLEDKARLARQRQVLRDLERGCYDHTPEELSFGARVAWRNSAKCIGRRVWKALDVIDCRSVTDPDDIAARVLDHVNTAYSDGRVRSVISIFPAANLTAAGPYIENAQVLQFAGYIEPMRGVLGDPLNVEFTSIAMSLGWSPAGERTSFDVLPLIIRQTDGSRRFYEIPRDVQRLVDITHPRAPALSQLGLRWCPIPIVSDMILSIGGIDYPCAPFNGYFMSTEIASRDLIDDTRYNLLESVANAIGIDRASSFWRERTAIELNEAVIYSFRKNGVTIIDPQIASEQFIDFIQAERASGRAPSADWAWIVPPTGGSTCPVFHLPMADLHDVPNFYRSRAVDGGALGVSRATERQDPFTLRLRDLQRRIRRWQRSKYR